MTGFRVVSPLARVFKELRKPITASVFEPDVMRFVKQSLATAIKLTPARNLSLITRNQKRQYKRRVNFIPSSHELIDPSLIVTDSGEEWLYARGKWWRPQEWKLPDDIYTTYEYLATERKRRMATPEGDFVKDRAQARFLYKKSWYEIGQSIGINVPCSSAVKDARTRRKPPVNPPRGYAQRRGGKGTFSVVIYNPFLDASVTSRYGPGNSGRGIIESAMNQHRGEFDERVAQRQTKALLRILRSLL